ncbi:helix-turn-helix transcriptional regulator [Dactylosporangium siamense]|uniref:HTH araC/xylS-type domain-containing protein n=1 Tax=Dactylosporangium siamense TaxID=685454 RepID=A0A919PTU7_9ACTN|nr:helix-turn-helix transcriptional regulator [Dactylosporangium siamense]GIG50089.1 hypothetical protein Dsi01nite_081300 [Dactylosporangium siamense]
MPLGRVRQRATNPADRRAEPRHPAEPAQPAGIQRGVHGEIPGSWRAALADDRIARALDAAYAESHRPWTLHALARVAGMGRTAFTARFRELVGESPFAHLTRWRMDLAATMLRDEPGRTLAEVAAAVGYSDEFAFGAAFRREVGTPPGTYRTLN